MRICGFVMAAVALLCMGATSVMAEEAPVAPPAKTVTITGVLSCTFDDEWNLTSVSIAEQNKAGKPVVYGIVLDENGMALGEALDGEKVEVTAILKKDKDTMSLTVKGFKSLAAMEPVPDPEDDPEDEPEVEPVPEPEDGDWDDIPEDEVEED